MRPTDIGRPTVGRHAEQSQDNDQGVTERAKQAASAASDQAGQVAETARNQAREVTSEISTQAREVMHELRTDLRDQSVTQRDRLAGALRQFSDDLDRMAASPGQSGFAASAATQLAGKSRELSQFLQGHEPSDLLDEIRRFARQRPGAFLAGSALAGVLVGRLTRGAAAGSSADRGTEGLPDTGPSIRGHNGGGTQGSLGTPSATRRLAPTSSVSLTGTADEELLEPRGDQR
jgi:hypothetical protein